MKPAHASRQPRGHWYGHPIALISILFIATNLVFWCIPLFSSVLLRTIPALRGAMDRVITQIYRNAVLVDSFWIERVLRIDIRLHGEPPPSDPGERLVIVSNHVSWFDVLVIQGLITRRGPMIKFLIKKQLIFVPVIGWICLALNFPRLNRSGREVERNQDYAVIESAATGLRHTPAAILNFAEGTRFTEAKHARGGGYRYLLNPKSGGLRIMLSNLDAARVADLTLVYPSPIPSFWAIMGGSLACLDVHLRYIAAKSIDDPGEWLNTAWQMKDALIARSRQQGV